MPAHEVHFILDPTYSGDLWSLSRRAHVWICNSPENDGQIKQVGDAESEGYSPLRGVSSFRMGDDVLATFYNFLGTIDEHHDEYWAPTPWSTIHVVGLSPKDVSKDRVLEELSADAVSIEPGEGAFTIRRSEQVT